MSVGKGFVRPSSWPPVGSIIQVSETVRLGSGVAADEGDWVVVHLTNGIIRESDGTRHQISLSLLHDGDRPRYRVFRMGRKDYSQAWHQVLPWMESSR